MSVGLACPSVGRNAAPTTSSTCHQRPELLRLLRREQLHLEAEGARGRRLPLHLGPALGVAGQTQAAVPLPAGREARLRLEPVVERDRVAEELGDVGIGAELPDQPRRVPGRAGRSLARSSSSTSVSPISPR